MRDPLRPSTLGRACDVLEALLADIGACCPFIDRLIPAGDVRRFEPIVESLVLVGRAADPVLAMDALAAMSRVEGVIHRDARRIAVAMQGEYVDIRVAAPDEYGTMLFRATGAAEHVEAIQRRRGPSLSAHEEDVYTRAGLPFIPAELRQGAGEIEAAAAGRLPELVELGQMRGDLHAHTDYSDGRDPLDVMVAAAAARGYEYIAITDHSAGAAAARTVSADELRRQADEIARLRAQYPGMAILHGIEVDILPDGRLDFADALLEPLDIVLASLHDRAGQDSRRLTTRCVAAIRHPLVNVITHPSNQLVGRRAGYEMDYDAIYAAAAETGTALEIDGAPSHLDLDAEHARAAVAAGVTVCIDSDAHRAPALERQMRLGVGTARRGWVEARHVLNTRPLDELRRFLAAKRQG